MAISTVVNSAYDTSGNGGRKSARLSNGWLVAALLDNSVPGNAIRIKKSTDNGQNWSDLCYIDGGSSVILGKPAITSFGNTVYVIAFDTSSKVSFWRIDATTQTNVDTNSAKISVDTGQSSFDANLTGISLVIAPDGTLHAAWASKNSTYPNSYNIRYAKGTIDGNGNVSWGSVTQVTTLNTSGSDYTNPCVVVKSDNNPVIISQFANLPQIHCSRFSGGSWSTTTIYNSGNSSYTQSNPCAVVKKYGANIGRIFVGWHGLDSTDTTKQNVRIAYSDDGGATWTVIGKITTGNTVDRKTVTLTENSNGDVYAVYDDNGSIKYQVCANGTTTFSGLTTIDTGSNPSALISQAFTTVPVIYKTASSVKFSGSFNSSPTITLTSPADNQTLAEGSTYTIAGTASDPDNGNAVTVKYAINGGTTRNITSAVSDGSTPIPFSKTLTFQNGRLYDGETDVSGPLAENTTYTLSVWAVDDQGGTSTSYTRTFTVILNRPPAITLDPYNANQTGMSELEALTFTGTITDPENDTITLTATFNGGAAETLKAGVPSGTAFEYVVPIAKLVTGANTLVLKATDQKGASTTKTLTFTKTGTQTPVKTAVTRYAITPPLGSTAEIVAWVHREIGDLNVDAAFSIVGSDASEAYAAMTKNASVPVGDGTIYEDEFVGTVGTAGAKVTLRLTLTRADAASTKAVKKIMGGIG